MNAEYPTTAALLVPGALTPEMIHTIIQVMKTKDLTLLDSLPLSAAVKFLITPLVPFFKLLTIDSDLIQKVQNLLISGRQEEVLSSFPMDDTAKALIGKILESGLPTNPPLANPADPSPTVS